MKVNFFIAGGPKCGTTALATYLDTHPQVCFARPKEPWFFDTDLGMGKSNHNGSLDDYFKKFFSHYDSNVHKVIGEGTPLYLYSQVAIKKILHYNSSAKIIFMIRNPIEMVQSWHSQLIFNGLNHESEADLETAWKLQWERREGKSLPQKCIEPRQLQYKDICSLGTQLEKLYTTADKNNIFPIFLDDLKSNPREVYLQVEKFLGVEDDGRREFPIVNANKKNQWPGIKSSIQCVGRIKKKLGVNCSMGVGKRILKANTVKANRKSLRPEFKLELEKEFLPEIEKIERIMNRDLSLWK